MPGFIYPLLKAKNKLDAVVHAYNPKTQKAEARGQAQGQPE